MNEQEKSANPQRLFFDEHQWVTIEAAMARIIPTDDTAGAREAGAIYFLDRYLSSLDYIYAKPDGSGFLKLHGKRAASWQERIDTIRQRIGTARTRRPMPRREPRLAGLASDTNAV